MSPPAAMVHAPPAAPATAWEVLSARATGAHHSATGMACEDAVATLVEGDATVLAVSDGHGHHRHFRSRRGSELAVEVALAAALEWWRSRDATRPVTDEEARSRLLPAVWHQWVARVGDDIGADPFSEAERAQLRPGDDPVIAYGATLLFALLSPAWMVVAQIGDGDAVVIGDDESATPLPDDPELDGTRTTSLCQPDALRSFRVATRDLAAGPVRAVLLATDGYGNAQADADWPATAGPQLLKMIEEKGTGWVDSQLHSWVQRCASESGSGDDTTVAIGLAPGAPGPPGGGRTNRRRRYAAMAAAGLLLAGAGVGLGLALTSTGSGRAHQPRGDGASGSGRGSPQTLPVHAGDVTANVPGTTRQVVVPIPSAIGAGGVVAAIQEGSAVYILAGDGRVWRVPVPAARPAWSVAETAVLDAPRAPLGFVSGQVTVAGAGGRITYRIEAATMAVTCWNVGLGAPARTQCPAGQGGNQ